MITDLPAGLTLRRATNVDAEQVKRLVYEVLREYGMQPEPDHAEKGLDDIDNAFASGGLWVLCTEGGSDPGSRRVIGSIGIIAQGETICELTKMFLAPAMRGRGLGRQLLDFAIRQAQHRGFDLMHLESDTSLREAVALYRSAGFEIVPQKNSVARCDLVMRKAL